MNTLSDDNFPQICSEVGLSCESCTAETAKQVAAVCKGLAGKMIGQLFVQIYPNSACAPMHRHFAAHYREASAVQTAIVVNTAEESAFERREVGFVRSRIMVAVA